MRLKRVLAWSTSAIALALVLAFAIAYWRSDNTCGRDPVPRGPLMKAIVYCDYGTTEVLKLEDTEKPTPGDDEVLVKVHVTAINPLDWHYMRGTPYIIRAMGGLRKPADTRLGVDYSGTVEAVGKNVTTFKPGDEVLGARNGALAEYVVALADRAIVLKPTRLSFEQAAAVPVAAITALQGLRDAGNIQPGKKVLINGASGGVGTFAVQIAKSFGTEVTGVSSTRNLEMVRSIGADHVIDYTREDFTQGTQRYDLILDCVGTRPLLDFKRALTPTGTYVLVGGGGPEAGNWIGPMAGPVKAALLSPFVSQTFVMVMAETNKKDLTVLNELMQSGKVTPVIDRVYDLNETAEAIRYLEAGHARGKVVIRIASQRSP